MFHSHSLPIPDEGSVQREHTCAHQPKYPVFTLGILTHTSSHYKIIQPYSYRRKKVAKLLASFNNQEMESPHGLRLILSELMAEYEQHLASLQGHAATGTDFGTPTVRRSIVKQLSEDPGGEAVANVAPGERGKDTRASRDVDKVSPTDSIVKNAVSAA